MAAARFVVGIDLGTTNNALAYVDTGAGEGAEVRPANLAAGLARRADCAPGKPGG